jgi:polysaccharide chain length determinant protein (PEP-CTERM system associated)
MRSDFKLAQLPPLSWVRAIWKRKLLILALWVALGVVATAAVYLFPPVYRAEVLILVENQRIPDRFVSATVNADLTARLSSLSQQITSYTSLLKVIQKFDLYRDERRRLVEEEVVDLMRSHITVQLEPGFNRERQQAAAFRIGYESKNPLTASQVANELASQFIEQNLRSREVYALGTSEFLKTQVAEAKKKLEEQEAVLSEFKRRHSGELPQQESALASTLARLQVQLQAVQDEIGRTEQTKLLRDNELSAALSSQAALARMSEQTAAAALPGAPPSTDTEIEQLENRLAALRSRYTENHPDVKDTLAALERLKQARKQDSTPEPAAAPAQPRDPSSQPVLNGTLIREKERVEQIRAQILVLDRRLKDLEEEKKRILSEMSGVQQRIAQLPVREQQLAAIARDYEISKANYQSLLDKQLAAEMAAQMESTQRSERFVVLDPARIPEKPIRPDRLAWSLAGWAVAFGLAFLTGLAVEINKNVFLGEWELPREVLVLARVPKIVIRPPSGARNSPETLSGSLRRPGAAMRT